MLTGEYLAPFIEEIEQELPDKFTAAEWRAHRNRRLREVGVGGVIKNGKRSRSIPPWWTPDTEVWFDTEAAEAEFTNRLSAKNRVKYDKHCKK